VPDKDAVRLARDLERKGWTIKGGRHYKIYPPGGGPFLVMSTSPSGGRALRNIEAMIKRAEKRSVFGSP